MDVGSIFLILALVLLVGLYIGRPFFQPQVSFSENAQKGSAEHRRSALMAESDRLLTALQELDFDHRLGKIPAEDYPVMRGALTRSAAVVLRNLDEIHGDSQQSSVEERIEQVVAIRRADAAVKGAAVKPVARANDDIEELLATRKRDRQEKAAGFCPKCGKPALKSDRFCSRCGTTI